MKIEASLTAWATAVGITRDALERKMVKVGDQPSPMEAISAKRVFDALIGDETLERVRNLKLDADKKEREEKEISGQLFPMDQLDEWLSARYVEPMSTILSNVVNLASRCNPSSPEIAKRVLGDWIEETVKPALELDLDKPRKE